MPKPGLMHGATAAERVRNATPADLAQWQWELEVHIRNHRDRPLHAQVAVDKLAEIADALSDWYMEG